MLMPSKKECPQVSRRAGFTLLEILVVVAIVVTMAAVAGVGVFRYLEESKMSRAQLDVKALEKAVKAYQIKNDNNPPAWLEDALRYIDNATEANLKDPWNKPYQYNPEFEWNGSQTVLISTTTPKGDVIDNIHVKQSHN